MISTNLAGRRFAMAAAVALLVAAPAVAAPPSASFSLEQVLGAPFPSNLVAAPAGGRAAWVFNHHGARNVWVAEPTPGGGYAARPITAYAGDDGFDMGELNWSPDGRRVAYSRGGSLEGGGPVNTLSLPSGPHPQTVWIASAAGEGAPREIGPGHAPAISPKGDVVAFLQGGQIWTAPLAGGAPAQRVTDRGQVATIAWSPDGSRLAFVSVRGEHSLVGVLDFTRDRVAWMAPSVDMDMAPEWSPDGRRIAWVRLPAGRDQTFFAHREDATPWSIWAADSETGTGAPIWTAAKGVGSVFHGFLADRQLLWTAGDRIAFPWERTGWVHLYAVDAKGGGAATELSSGGGFEVFNVALSPDRRRIVYSANTAESDRWNLWSADVAGGGAPKPLTGADPSARGIEDYPVVTSDGHVLALHGAGRDPMRPVAVAASGAITDLAPGAIPADFPTAELVQPQAVTFKAADGQIAHGQLFLPKAAGRKPGPAVLFFHGGPYREMLVGWHPMDAYSVMYAMNQRLAAEGYVVLSVNYRGGIGYGMDYREAKGFGPGGASELNDILGAAAYLKARPDVDGARIGLWGGSYGGLMTALGLSRASNLLAAGVDYAGVHDWRAMLPALAEPLAPPGAAQLAYDSSAMATIGKWRSPVLVAHADDDRNVPFSQSVELVEGLRRQGVPFEQLILPDEIHNMLRERSWLTLFHAADDFFARQLKP